MLVLQAAIDVAVQALVEGVRQVGEPLRRRDDHERTGEIERRVVRVDEPAEVAAVAERDVGIGTRLEQRRDDRLGDLAVGSRRAR